MKRGEDLGNISKTKTQTIIHGLIQKPVFLSLTTNNYSI